MKSNNKLNQLKNLGRFIKDVASVSLPNEETTNPSITSLNEWQNFLKTKLGFSLVSIEKSTHQLQNASLVIAEHAQHGPVIIKNPINLFKNNTSRLLVLNTGDEQRCKVNEYQYIENIEILIDEFNWNDASIDAISCYLQLPIKKANQQLLKISFLSSLLISLMYMSGLDTLNYTVPSSSKLSYFNVLLFVTVIILLFSFSRYLIHRVQIWFSSIVSFRQKNLYLSMLSHLPLKKHSQFKGVISQVAELGLLQSGLKGTLTSCVALIPLALSIFLRMPFILVIVPLLITMSMTVYELFRKNKIYGISELHRQEELQAHELIYKSIRNIKPNLFYGRAQSAFNNYKSKVATGLNFEYKLQSHSFEAENNAQLFQGLALFIAMLITEKFISTSAEISTLTIGSAYMMLYLTNTVFRAFPRLIKVIEIKNDIKNRNESAEEMICDIIEPSEKSNSRLNGLDIIFTELVLPHSCTFTKNEPLSLRLKPNSMIAVRGKSGSGKSTFIRCLLGVEKSELGHISIGSVEPSELKNYERQFLFSYLSQDTKLITGSLRDNITLLSNSNIIDDEIWTVLKTVKLFDKFSSLPLLLDTPVMASGSSFSTGECQRILLAQLLLKPAKIMVLDEALSGVPYEMEIEILNDIVSRYVYLFRVSHRQDTRIIPDYCIQLGN